MSLGVPEIVEQWITVSGIPTHVLKTGSLRKVHKITRGKSQDTVVVNFKRYQTGIL